LIAKATGRRGRKLPRFSVCLNDIRGALGVFCAPIGPILRRIQITPRAIAGQGDKGKVFACVAHNVAPAMIACERRKQPKESGCKDDGMTRLSSLRYAAPD
jgi:hypothetical protein